MKPIGTITMHYPFLDSETRSAIEAIMDATQTYREFVLSLGEIVCENDVPVNLVYMAALHAWQLSEMDIMQRIRKKHSEHAIIRPWTTHRRISEESTTLLEQIRESIEDAIASNPKDWILVQLPQVGEGFLGIMSEFSELIEDVRSMLVNRPEFECFKPGFHNLQGWIYALEGDTKKAVSEIGMGLEIARRYDDRHREMCLLIDLANLTKNSNVKSALAHLEDAYVLCTELGARHDESVILNEMGLVSTILGEYDLALECHLGSIRIKESMGELAYFATLNLSHAYGNLRNGLDAFAWAKSAMECANPGNVIWSHLAVARSLICLQSPEKAEPHLDSAKLMALKSGHESVLGQYYYVLGLYEMAVGDAQAAVQTLELALDIYERQNILLYVVYCLLALTEAELLITRANKDLLDSDFSGPWMLRLQKIAEDYDLPGILMYHALLKAEFQLIQGRRNSAKETLQDALRFSNTPGVRSLRIMISDSIEEID